MAKALFNFESASQNKDAKAQSAGVRPFTHIIEDSVEIMDELGIDIRNHRPNRLSLEMIDWADEIILLDKSIREELINLPSEKRDKIVVWDIEDPYMAPKENFRNVRDLIYKKILELLDEY